MNMQEIANKLDFDLEDVEMLVDMFLSDSYASLENVKPFIMSNDFIQIKNTAHGIKGSSANLMLEDITKLALEIENLAKSEVAVDYGSLFEKIKTELTHIEEIKATT